MKLSKPLQSAVKKLLFVLVLHRLVSMQAYAGKLGFVLGQIDRNIETVVFDGQ